MGKALYRKYRSKSFDEVIGQEHITTTLKNALKTGKISHAYLFTGPKGVGKTSVARILAHEVNGFPYDEESVHLDIIEIDAASNRRIDEIRDLRDKVHIAPSSGKYKVYIIDEVHMLTKEAFNALLKTLEEPPEHVIFILATTEAHKLPDTIISRTQRYTFKAAGKDTITEHLASIAKKEKIDISPDALELLAEHGDGSFRDSIGLLDQARSLDGKIALETVENLLGIAPSSQIDALVEILQSGTPAQLAEQLRTMEAKSYSPPLIAKQLGVRIRQNIIDGSGWPETHEGLGLLKQLLKVQASQNTASYLEIVLIEYLLRRGLDSTQSKPIAAEVVASEPKIEKIVAEPEPLPEEPPFAPPVSPSKTEEPVKDISSRDELWLKLLNEVKKRHNTLHGVLRIARPEVSETKLTLYFKFPFHQKRLDESKNLNALAEILKQVAGKDMEIESVLEKNAHKPPLEPDIDTGQPKEDNLQNVSNIFGSAELLD